MENYMDYINDQLQIDNRFSSLISLIDHIYPPLKCALCDTVFLSDQELTAHYNERHYKKAKYLCIHPHCEKRYKSKGALRFHISHTHIVNQASGALLESPFINYTHNDLLSSTNANDNLHPLNTNASFAAEVKPTTTVIKPTIDNIIASTNHSPIKSKPSMPKDEQFSCNNNNNITSSSNGSSYSFIQSPSLSPKTMASKTSTHNDRHSIKKPTAAASIMNGGKKEKQFLSSPILNDLTPSPPPSPFLLYQQQKTRKPTLSQKAEKLLNSIYPPLQCPSCHLMFNRKTNVIKHLTEAHVGEEPYRCIYPKCNHPKIYATREGLVYHIVRVHDQK